MGAAQADGDGAWARVLEQRAYATLVFPDITKAGFLIGGEYGNGVLFRRNGVAGYFNLAGVSYGFQAGAQSYSLVMFFMNEWSWRALSSTDGFQVGVGPSVVVLDEGKAKIDYFGNVDERCLCLRLRSAGTDGGCRPAGYEDHSAQLLDGEVLGGPDSPRRNT